MAEVIGVVYLGTNKRSLQERDSYGSQDDFERRCQTLERQLLADGRSDNSSFTSANSGGTEAMEIDSEQKPGNDEQRSRDRDQTLANMDESGQPCRAGSKGSCRSITL